VFYVKINGETITLESQRNSTGNQRDFLKFLHHINYFFNFDFVNNTLPLIFTGKFKINRNAQ